MAKILITGCSTGFGHDAALRFAERGDDVYATMRATNDKNAEVADELRRASDSKEGSITVVELDVVDDASVRTGVDEILGAAGHLDVVINNAGQMYVGITEAFETDQLARQLDVNVLGPFRVLRATLPSMRERGEGLVINVSSVAGRLAFPFFGVYHASKWALEGLTQSFRYELAPFGVEVVLVEPGPFTTELFPRSPGPEDEATKQAYGSMNDVLDEMATSFEDVFADDSISTDPADVVEAFVDLVSAEPGSRPFRTVVGVDFGVREINERTAPLQVAVMEEMGLAHLEDISTANAALQR